MKQSHRARKRFGQHFLTAPETIQQIIDAIAPAAGETLVEIGPGQGELTMPLAKHAVNLHAIEFDRDLVAMLRSRFADADNVTIHEADALKFDFARLGSRLRVLGNLPYNISTPLLFRMLEFESLICDMHFMLQKEVVNRICASPGSKEYGRLTIMLGSRVDVLPLFDVPPQAFSPPPRVMSAVIRMQPLPPGTYHIQNPQRLSAVVAQAFSMRRKTLHNALKGIATDSELKAANIDPGARPEQVAVSNWIELVNQLDS